MLLLLTALLPAGATCLPALANAGRKRTRGSSSLLLHDCTC